MIFFSLFQVFLQFQSTLPSQGATLWFNQQLAKRGDFNPRSPHRERRIRLDADPVVQKFQSTLPSQGATATLIMSHFVQEFQSTLPSQGATSTRASLRTPHHIFQSTLPSQGATAASAGGNALVSDFNPRSPHRERQQICT